MTVRVAGAVEKRKTKVSLNNCWALLKNMQLSKLLNHCFACTAMASIMSRRFWTWNWGHFIWSIMLRLSGCQGQIFLIICYFHTSIKTGSLFVYYLCVHMCKTYNFNFLLFCHVSDTSSALPHLSLSGFLFFSLSHQTHQRNMALSCWLLCSQKMTGSVVYVYWKAGPVPQDVRLWDQLF